HSMSHSRIPEKSWERSRSSVEGRQACSSASDRSNDRALAFGVHLSISLRRATTIAAMAMFAIAAASCGREPTDPSRTSLTGFWKSFDVDLYIHNIEMEIHEN